MLEYIAYALVISAVFIAGWVTCAMVIKRSEADDVVHTIRIENLETGLEVLRYEQGVDLGQLTEAIYLYKSEYRKGCGECAWWESKKKFVERVKEIRAGG